VIVNGQTVSASGGTWSTTLSKPVTDGDFTVTVTATDPATNVGQATRVLKVDTTKPTLAITDVEGGDDSISNDEAAHGIKISGTVADAGAVSVVVNGESAKVANGTWTVTLPEPTEDGELTVTATATDAAGNATKTTRVLQANLTPPTVAITSIEGENDNISPSEAAGGITISGTVELGSTVHVNGVKAEVSGTTWTVLLPDPKDNGKLHVKATATSTSSTRRKTRRRRTLPSQRSTAAMTISRRPRPPTESGFPVRSSSGPPL
jgi:large repetitive protein